MKKAVIFSLVSALFISSAESTETLAPTPDLPQIKINTAIDNITNAQSHPYLEDQLFLSFKKSINDLYFVSSQQLLWIDPSSTEPQHIDKALQLITNAPTSGLVAEHYNIKALQAQWQKLHKQETVSPSEYLFLDTAVSFSLAHFLSDIRFGRLDPKKLTVNYNTKNTALFLVPIIMDAISNNKIAQLTEMVQPSSPKYQQLKKALQSYKHKEPKQSLKQLIYTSTLRPNDLSKQVLSIRQHLLAFGYLSADNTFSFLYDRRLTRAVKEFQAHHGLKEDGIIGKNTIKALNIQPFKKTQMLRLALERFRWLPKVQANPRIMVNIPAFKLTAYHPSKEGSAAPQVLDMRVIVGKSKKDKFKSPIFSAEMLFLEFSPYWNIPDSITFDEILPKLQQNPFYLEEHNMEVVSGFHNNEIGISYSEDLLDQIQTKALKLRQRPGKGNSLGRVKFIFPNNYNVYLHDTPARHLFRKEKRDLSHGCIRVAKPAELAKFLLQTKPGWTEKEIIKAMYLSSPKKVWLKKAVPVIIYYSTASIEQGEVIFYHDVYHYDDTLAQALMKYSPPPPITGTLPKIQPTSTSSYNITTLG